ncbi:serine/threonine-protein kinase 32B-like isoform X2 [Stegodyphus dumicola]|uniref:serine/threonine-protein kinase 32B-like isoform X2 n=1 Tax=Stegodyphus dumicola TaxID=202533 RepID=UPI0015ADF36B|nr:serine/threonine-protein kinase 32B-like isoform X2 [Stegodyphus dumicola]
MHISKSSASVYKRLFSMGNSKGRIPKMLSCSSPSRDSSVNTSTSKSSSVSQSSAQINSVSPDNFRIIKKIGKGSFGKVYAVEKRGTKELFAMKVIENEESSEKDHVKSITKEVEILSSLNHPFIVTLWYAFVDEDSIYLVFELLSGGDLRHCIEEDNRLPSRKVVIYLCEVALALDYLKAKNILHRDIKPENLLLDEHGHIRLIDFNIAIELKDGELATSMCGTKPYVAPEVYRCLLDLGPGYSFPADWWSLGICGYEMLSGKRPYDIHSTTSLEDTLGMILLSNLTFPIYVENGMRDLISQILCSDVDQRLCSVDRMRKHPYLKSIDFNHIYEEEIMKTVNQINE